MMKLRKAIGYVLIITVLAYLAWPAQTAEVIDDLTPAERHWVTCDTVVVRQLGNPSIKSVSCSSGDSCGGIDALDVLGDYRGNLEMSLGGKTVWSSFTVGLGVLSEATTTVPLSACVKDGNQEGYIRLHNGDKTSLLDAESFDVVVS